MAERRFAGRSASAGIAIGSLVKVSRSETRDIKRLGDPALEEVALRDAMAKAAVDLEALADVASGDGADILAFQIEMLADPALVDDVLIKIGKGEVAIEAWRAGLQGQIDDYKNADDGYFRARASDLDDLKDRVGRALSGAKDVAPDLVDGAILLDRDLTPSRFLALDFEKLGSVALQEGSVSSHVSMLARARGLPMIVGLGEPIDGIGEDGDDVIIDAEQGFLIVAPATETRQRYKEVVSAADDQARIAASRMHQAAITKDGQPIDVMINIDDPAAVDDDTLKAAGGVGLLRTEFLFMGRDDLPGEEEQCRAYRDLTDRLEGRPAIIRT
ncbi:MAG: putative PEP-binding protein, partial [Geminicoccaceae bacterium]